MAKTADVAARWQRTPANIDVESAGLDGQLYVARAALSRNPESVPNVSARDRTDTTGVTGHACPPNSFKESFQGKEKLQQAAAGEHAECDTAADIPRKPPGDSRPQGTQQSGSSPEYDGCRDDEGVEGFSGMQILLAKCHVRVQPGQIQGLIEAGRAHGLALDGVLAFVEDKLKQKRDQNDPVFSAKLLINAISDDADLYRWAVKRHRCSSFFEQTPNRGQQPFSVAELRAHLSYGAQTLRNLSGYEEIAVELDLLVADPEAQFRDLEALDQRLTALEENVIAIALAQKPEADLTQMRQELALTLEPYRRKMSEEQLAMLERQYRGRWLLEFNGLPRLGLFYLRGTERAA